MVVNGISTLGGENQADDKMILYHYYQCTGNHEVRLNGSRWGHLVHIYCVECSHSFFIKREEKKK